jgi:hypothetical protein
MISWLLPVASQPGGPAIPGRPHDNLCNSESKVLFFGTDVPTYYIVLLKNCLKKKTHMPETILWLMDTSTEKMGPRKLFQE